MGEDRHVTAAEVLAAVRKRRPVCERVDIGNPATAAQVLAGFETSMRRRADLGMVKRAANIVLEPRNPFEPNRPRKPKKEAVIFGTLLALVLAALVFFNLSAPQLRVQP